MSYALPHTTAELLLRASEAAYILGPEAKTEDVATFLGGAASNAEAALTGARELGFIEQGADDSHWNPLPLAQVLASAPPGAKTILLRFQLEKFPPYALFRDRLLAGEAPSDATRQTCLRHELDLDVLSAEGVLTNWGTYCGGLVYGPDQRLLVTINEALLTEALSVYEGVLAERDSVRAHIVERLGVEAAGFTTGEVLDRLIDSYVTILKGGPFDEAMFHLGHGLEAFVKSVAEIDPPISLPQNVKTLGSVVLHLRDEGRLIPKHSSLFLALTAVRNAADHAVDPEIGATWQITREMAFSANHLAWSAIRSFFAIRAGNHEL